MSYDDYSEEGGSSYARGGRGYSRGDAKEHMINKIGEMMDEAETPKEREALKECMKAIERA